MATLNQWKPDSFALTNVKRINFYKQIAAVLIAMRIAKPATIDF